MNNKIERVNEIRDSNSLGIYTPTRSDVQIAEIVSEWTKNYGNMLPKSRDEILKYFKLGNSIIVRTSNGELIAHGAIVDTYSNGWAEFGTLATNSKFRNKGAGTIATVEVIKQARKQNPNIKIFALANPISSRLFAKLGATVLSCELLPPEVWLPCATCPNSKTSNDNLIFKCCDTPYELTNIAI